MQHEICKRVENALAAFRRLSRRVYETGRLTPGLGSNIFPKPGSTGLDPWALAIMLKLLILSTLKRANGYRAQLTQR
jgi:hypothetical protein